MGAAGRRSQSLQGISAFHSRRPGSSPQPCLLRRSLLLSQRDHNPIVQQYIQRDKPLHDSPALMILEKKLDQGVELQQPAMDDEPVHFDRDPDGVYTIKDEAVPFRK